MKAIDSLLKILVQQGATELRLASDRRPQMFKEDAELPLTIPAMSTERIRDLLDDLWTSHEASLRQRGELSLTYSSAELGKFVVMLVQQDESTLEVRFRRDGNALREPDASASSERRAEVRTGPRERSRGETGKLPAAFVAVLTRAASQGASDIHLSPQGAPIVRINGALQTFEGAPGFDATALLGGQEQLEHVRAGGSVDRAFDVPAVGRVRVNVYTSDSRTVRCRAHSQEGSAEPRGSALCRRRSSRSSTCPTGSSSPADRPAVARAPRWRRSCSTRCAHARRCW